MTLGVERPWAPFSEESLWHVCPGHEWERFEYDKNRGGGEQPLLEVVTRCSICGAARCDIFERPEHVTPQLWEQMSDHDQQLYRCTEERHHEGDHDFLTGGDSAR